MLCVSHPPPSPVFTSSLPGCLPACPPACLQGDIWVDALVSSAGDTVSVSVHDTGIGIPGEKLEDIFAPFAQVRRGMTAGGQARSALFRGCTQYCDWQHAALLH